jgi:serine/threonine protein kinase
MENGVEIIKVGTSCLWSFKSMKPANLLPTFDFDAPSFPLSSGIPEYSCPEILKGEQFDKSADLWSIGVITYVLQVLLHFISDAYSSDFVDSPLCNIFLRDCRSSTQLFYFTSRHPTENYRRNIRLFKVRMVLNSSQTTTFLSSSHISRAAKDFVKKLLVVNPQHRMTTDEVAQAG